MASRCTGARVRAVASTSQVSSFHGLSAGGTWYAVFGMLTTIDRSRVSLWNDSLSLSRGVGDSVRGNADLSRFCGRWDDDDPKSSAINFSCLDVPYRGRLLGGPCPCCVGVAVLMVNFPNSFSHLFSAREEEVRLRSVC